MDNHPHVKPQNIPEKTEDAKHFKTVGTLKSHVPHHAPCKDFYTPQEARRFTRADLDRNPALLRALEDSMTHWQ